MISALESKFWEPSPKTDGLNFMKCDQMAALTFFLSKAFSFNSKLKVEIVGQFLEQVLDISYTRLVVWFCKRFLLSLWWWWGVMVIGSDWRIYGLNKIVDKRNRNSLT